MIITDVEKHSLLEKIQLIRSASKLAELVEIMTGHVSYSIMMSLSYFGFVTRITLVFFQSD